MHMETRAQMEIGMVPSCTIKDFKALMIYNYVITENSTHYHKYVFILVANK